MKAVVTRGLTRRFGEFTAVDGMDLAVSPGEVVAVLGANGAGKTTLMRMILGLLLPSAGTVELFGGPPSRETRLRTGYVPQGLGLYRDLTVAENLEFTASAFDVSPAAVPGASGARLFGDLSLGIQRRVAFASALQHSPDLLVLDEPTSGVAPLARVRLWEQIRVEAERGAAVLVTTHYMDEARRADRLILMAAGRVIGTGREADIVGDAGAVVVRTDRWNEAFNALDAAGEAAALMGRTVRVPGSDPARIAALLEDAGITAATHLVPATLEEAMVLASRGTP